MKRGLVSLMCTALISLTSSAISQEKPSREKPEKLNLCNSHVINEQKFDCYFGILVPVDLDENGSYDLVQREVVYSSADGVENAVGFETEFHGMPLERRVLTMDLGVNIDGLYIESLPNEDQRKKMHEIAAQEPLIDDFVFMRELTEWSHCFNETKINAIISQILGFMTPCNYKQARFSSSDFKETRYYFIKDGRLVPTNDDWTLEYLRIKHWSRRNRYDLYQKFEITFYKGFRDLKRDVTITCSMTPNRFFFDVTDKEGKPGSDGITDFYVNRPQTQNH